MRRRSSGPLALRVHVPRLAASSTPRDGQHGSGRALREVWRPLLRWSEQQVVDIHHRHGLCPNPLYLPGASRVGCRPCIFVLKAEVRLIADTGPARIVRLRVIKDDVATAVQARSAGEPRTDERSRLISKPRQTART